MNRVSNQSSESRWRGRSLAKAFTMVELLVVIAVLAILASLMLPALAAGFAKARSMQCLNNTRQIALGWHLYAGDNAENLAPNQTNSVNSWVSGVLDFAGGSDNTNIAKLINPALAKLGPYVKAPGTYKCASDKSVLISRMGQSPRVRSYAMNFAVGAGVAPGGLPFGGPYRIYKRSSQLISPGPSSLWLLMDEHPDSIDDCTFVVDLERRDSKARLISVPANYHNGVANIAFADGHTEKHRWLDSRTLLPNRYCGCVSDYAAQGFFTEAPGSADVAWLQERTSSRVTNDSSF